MKKKIIAVALLLMLTLTLLIACNGKVDLELKSAPEQSVYMVGEKLNLNGGKLTVKEGKDSSEVSIGQEMLDSSTYNMNKAGNYDVKVVYKGKTVTFAISVKDNFVVYINASIAELPQLANITLENKDRITKLYNTYNALIDAEKAKITNADALVQAFEKIEALESATIKVDITAPTKTAYILGETLDLTGSGIKVTKENGIIVDEKVTADMVENFSTTTKLGEVVVTIKYNSYFSKDFTITVSNTAAALAFEAKFNVLADKLANDTLVYADKAAFNQITDDLKALSALEKQFLNVEVNLLTAINAKIVVLGQAVASIEVTNAPQNLNVNNYNLTGFEVKATRLDGSVAILENKNLTISTVDAIGEQTVIVSYGDLTASAKVNFFANVSTEADLQKYISTAGANAVINISGNITFTKDLVIEKSISINGNGKVFNLNTNSMIIGKIDGANVALNINDLNVNIKDGNNVALDILAGNNIVTIKDSVIKNAEQDYNMILANVAGSSKLIATNTEFINNTFRTLTEIKKSSDAVVTLDGENFNALVKFDFVVNSVYGNDNNSGLDEANAYQSIEKALSMASDGDIIAIAPGEYYNETGEVPTVEGITFYISGKVVFKTISEAASSISVVSNPSNSVVYGSELNLEGLVILITFNNGTTKELAYSASSLNFSIIGDTKGAIGNKNLTVVYNNILQAQFTVSITVPEDVANLKIAVENLPNDMEEYKYNTHAMEVYNLYNQYLLSVTTYDEFIVASFKDKILEAKATIDALGLVTKETEYLFDAITLDYGDSLSGNIGAVTETLVNGSKIDVDIIVGGNLIIKTFPTTVGANNIVTAIYTPTNGKAETVEFSIVINAPAEVAEVDTLVKELVAVIESQQTILAYMDKFAALATKYNALSEEYKNLIADKENYEKLINEYEVASQLIKTATVVVDDGDDGDFKDEYRVGEALDVDNNNYLKGVSIEVVLYDGTEKTIYLTKDDIKGFDTTTLGKKVLTFNYKFGYTELPYELEITVLAPQAAQEIIESIEALLNIENLSFENDYGKVKAIRAAIKALDESKNFADIQYVYNYDDFKAIEANFSSVASVVDLIKAFDINTLTYQDKAAVDSARTAYDALTSANKTLAGDNILATLVSLEEKIVELGSVVVSISHNKTSEIPIEHLLNSTEIKASDINLIFTAHRADGTTFDIEDANITSSEYKADGNTETVTFTATIGELTSSYAAYVRYQATP